MKDLETYKKQILDQGWLMDWDAWAALSPYERDFFDIEFNNQRAFRYYLDRLQALGFTNKESVLDIACGMGQWSMALAGLNKSVFGLDINVGRLLFAQRLAGSMGYTNTQFAYGSMERLEVPSQSYEAVFCYGAFMFSDMEKTISEFSRVLKNGGRVYLNANTTGWYIHLFLDRGLKARNLGIMRTVIIMLLRTVLNKKGGIIVRKKWADALFKRAGFRIVSCGIEGTINIGGLAQIAAPAYPPSFYGFPSILEYVLEKEA